jgi:acetylornithine deacetylase/succinyl-diaminopimelate desuccinylase-like protein
MPFGDRRLYGVCVAEKGTFRFAVRARGRAGHASVPGLADNALVKLVPVLARLAERRPAFDVRARAARRARGARRRRRTIRRLRWRSCAGSTRGSRAHRADARRHDGADGHHRLAEDQRHPARAELRVDCRVPPAWTASRR